MTLAEMQATDFDMEEAEAFMMKIGDIVNSGAIAVMLSIGHRTGLLDSMAGRDPRTSRQIADAAALSERYVREWLAVLVMAGIILYHPEAQQYELPDAHAACLTRDAALGNLAVQAQFVPMIGAVQEPILECFKSGGGMKYDDYPGFHRVMAEDSQQTVVDSLLGDILPLAVGLRERLDHGIDVMDASCGSGRALTAMAARFPNSRFVGSDLCPDAIAAARTAIATAGLSNILFEVRDLTNFNAPEHFDLITSFDAVHDQKQPQDFLKRIRAALRPGGVHLMQDIGGSADLENNYDFPFAALLYTISCLHCTPVSLGQGGDGLGTMWGWETAEAMLREAGFAHVERHVLPHDPMNVWFISNA